MSDFQKRDELVRELVEALEQMVLRFGFHGRGALDQQEYYCEVCGRHHEDSDLIQHAQSCPMTASRSVLANAKAIDAEETR